MRALDLAQPGWKQRAIAVALDASKGGVSRWLAAARRGGPEALLSHPAPGRVAQLTPEQFRLIPDFLGHGAAAYGFRGDVWTWARVPGSFPRSSASRPASARCRGCSSAWVGPRRSPSPEPSTGTRR